MINLRRQHIPYLTEEIRPTNLSKDEIYAYADKVRDIFKLSVDGDLTELVKSLKGRIHYVDLDDMVEHPESIYVHGKHDFDLVLPVFTSRRRDRFTIAHELGHYFLHSNQGKIPIVACRKGSSRLEWEANWFAAELLMPKMPFKEYLSQHDNNLSLAATHFGVSTEAAGVRARELN